MSKPDKPDFLAYQTPLPRRRSPVLLIVLVVVGVVVLGVFGLYFVKSAPPQSPRPLQTSQPPTPSTPTSAPGGGQLAIIPAADEPQLAYLPSRLWLIGLGHLGQAYLWGLGLLPFPAPSDLTLVLQDTDIITPSTESTSVPSDATLLGQKKARAMAAWAE